MEGRRAELGGLDLLAVDGLEPGLAVPVAEVAWGWATRVGDHDVVVLAGAACHVPDGVASGFGVERPWTLIVLWPALVGAVALGVASVVFAYWFLDGVVVKTMELINGKARS